MTEAAPAAGRSCGDCALCCKVYPIPAMDKPRGAWCRAWKAGAGCTIRDDRPQFCRDFHCTWMLDSRLGPEWKPSVCKFVMNWTENGLLFVTMEPNSPLAYRKEPYYGVLKSTSRTCLAKGEKIIIFSGASKYVMLPDGEHLLGPRDATFDFHVTVRTTGGQESYSVVVTRQEPLDAVA
jgi:hypothetical protein